MPKKVKYRKQQRGRMTGKAWRGSTLAFGDFGLKVLEPGWITDRQIEASRVAMTRFVKRGGKIWIRVFPDKPVTKKPAETRMGKGKGAEIDKLKAELQKRTSREMFVDIQEVHKPELDAQLVSEAIALQLEKRVGFRRAMRKAVDSALRFGCKGIKVRVSGRLNGNEIARSEWYLQGRLPLHTLRADIEYGFSEARTTYGVIGVKVWVYKGEILPTKKREQQTAVGAF